MILGIDASNIISGGGLTHLIEILNEFKYDKINKIIIWSNKNTLKKLKSNKKIIKKNNFFLNKNIFFRFYWQIFILKRELKKNKCDLLFVPGGSYIGSFKPYVAMSQNMIPFQSEILKKYRFSFMYFKFLLLKVIQKKTFINSYSNIFLTNHAKEIITEQIKIINDKDYKYRIIPHGINNLFRLNLEKYDNINNYNLDKTFNIIYVSKIDEYKNHLQVTEAVRKLKENKYPIKLSLVGSNYPKSYKNLMNNLKIIKNYNEYIKILGEINYKKLPKVYNDSDLIIFASSCENLPIILLEGMATGLPIVSSKNMPMPEILIDSAIYFNPLNSNSIYKGLKKMIENPLIRQELSIKSKKLSLAYNWEKCSNETFKYLYDVYKELIGLK